MPTLVNLQCTIITLPGIQEFIKSNKYYPLGDDQYVAQVRSKLIEPYSTLIFFVLFYFLRYVLFLEDNYRF